MAPTDTGCSPKRCVDHDLKQLLDIVPNHMSVADRGNRWWWDVLADGMSSPYARFFDIDWEADEPRLRHRVLLPLLGDQIGRVLEDGEIWLLREGGELLGAYAAHRFPLAVESVAVLLATSTSPAVASFLHGIGPLVAGDDESTRRERFAQRTAVVQALPDLLADKSVAAAVDSMLAARSSDLSDLDRILNEQHYRLARWQTASEEVNYRRFFDINTLVALRIEDPVVFAESTALIAELVGRGDADGARVDHIDGLRRPLEYAARLLEAMPPQTWLLAEKILARGEQPPPWALDGTSGYDFLAIANGLFVDPDGRAPLEALHTEFTGNSSDFATCARDGKREILHTTLVSDVERLTNLLAVICDAYPAQRDHTRSELSSAIIELIAAIPVYRTYVDPARGTASDVDAGIVRGAAAQAQHSGPHIDSRLLDFVADLFVFGEPEDVATSDTAPTGAVRRDFLLRFQQLCAAATAKGVEDTAFYRHLVLTSLNEVGDSPAQFGVSVDEFHSHSRLTQGNRPYALLATSTHDTKRSEDVRARINLLSEIPHVWAAAVHRWRAINDRHRQGEWPDSAMEYLLYQTLVGAWPLSAERVIAYMRKASREAKQHTSWLEPDEAYDAALAAFATAVVADTRFASELEGLLATMSPHGSVNSLSATLLKLTSPGVPDIYQGTETWDFSLVDPDNRRPVDFALRRRLLDSARAKPLWRTWPAGARTGTAKIGLIATALALRRRRPEAFDDRVSYNEKHNEANGEENRDGTDDNRSWNCGVEGDTDDPDILALRAGQQRNLVATVLLSQGCPMLVAGVDIGHTQRGNNNVYCQDNELTWLDWGDVDEGMLDFTRRLIALRAEQPVLRRQRFFAGQVGRRQRRKDVVWLDDDDNEMSEAEWDDQSRRSLAMLLNGDEIPDHTPDGLRSGVTPFWSSSIRTTWTCDGSCPAAGAIVGRCWSTPPRPVWGIRFGSSTRPTSCE